MSNVSIIYPFYSTSAVYGYFLLPLYLCHFLSYQKQSLKQLAARFLPLLDNICVLRVLSLTPESDACIYAISLDSLIASTLQMCIGR